MLEMAVTWPKQVVSESYERRHCKTARQLRSSEIDALALAYRSGSTVYELAAQFGIHRSTVGQHLRACGVDTTPPGISLDDVPTVVRLYQEGWSLAKLSEKFDTTDNTVSRRLRAAGVVMRRPWERGGQEEISRSAGSRD
jgi:DNA-binding transcriptional ArsR family regulator